MAGSFTEKIEAKYPGGNWATVRGHHIYIHNGQVVPETEPAGMKEANETFDAKKIPMGKHKAGHDYGKHEFEVRPQTDDPEDGYYVHNKTLNESVHRSFMHKEQAESFLNREKKRAIVKSIDPEVARINGWTGSHI